MIRERAVAAGAATGVVLAFSLVLAVALPNVYRSSAVVMMQGSHIQETYIRQPSPVGVQERFVVLTQQILSHSQLIAIMRDLKLYPKLLAHRPEAEVADYMRERIEIEPRSDRSVKITFEGSDPHQVQQVAAKIASLYIELSLKASSYENRTVTKFLAAEVEETSKRIAEQGKAIAAFKARHAEEMPEQEASIESRIEQALRERDSQQDALLAARQRLEILDRTPGHGGDSLDQLRAQLVQLKQVYTERHPDVRRLKEQIKRAEQAPAAPAHKEEAEFAVGTERLGVEQEIARREGEIKRLEDTVADLRERRAAIPKVTQEFQELTQGFKAIQDRYDALLSRRFEARLSNNLESMNEQEHMQILDPAPLPSSPVKPRRLRIAGLGFIMSLLAGLGMPLVLAEIDPSFRSEDEVKLELGEPVLGSVPRVSSRSTRRAWRRMAAKAILASALLMTLAVTALRWYLVRF